MNEDITQEILDELFSSLQALETQSAALLQFMKEKGIAKEEDLAPYFEQAKTASAIRWRASRVRIEHLLEGAAKASERKAEEEKEKEAPARVGDGNRESAQEAPKSVKKSPDPPHEDRPAANNTAQSEASPKTQLTAETQDQREGQTSTPAPAASGAQTGDRPNPGDVKTKPNATDTAA